MANFNIIPYQEVTNFELNEDFGVYIAELSTGESLDVQLTPEFQYIVYWNNEKYVCIAQSTDLLPGAVVFGNMSKIDPSKTDTLEPFIIGQHPVLGFFAVPLDKETVSEEDLYTVLVYEENCVIPMAFAPYGFTSLTIPFVEGENYTVYWDGTSYSCQGWSAEIEGETFVALGSTELAQWFIDGGNYAPPASEYPFMLAAIPSSYIFGEPGATIGLVVTAEGLGTQKLFGVYSDPNSKNILPLSEKVLNGFIAEEYFVSFNLDEQKEYRILWANSNFVLDQDVDFESGKIATLKDLDSILNIGQKYYVVFNGNLYICTAFEDESNPSLIALGNRAVAVTNAEGVEDTGEPFLFALHPSTKEAAVITKENYEIVQMTIIGIGEVQEYFCVPVNFEGNLALGNLNIIDIHSGTDEFEDSGEPFLIMSAIKQGMTGIATNQVNPIVLLGIYEHGDISSEEDPPDGIIIRDPLGRPITYGDYSKIILSRASGVKSIFSEGEAVSGNINLDFKRGNMTVRPEKRKLWSSLIIEKPSTLVSNNIVKDVNIAGIIGNVKIYKQEKISVPLDFSNKDTITITPDTEALFSEVNIEKPDNLTPENIVKGVNIAGIEGTNEGSAVTLVEEEVDLYFRDCLYASSSEEMQALLTDSKYMGMAVRYIGTDTDEFIYNHVYRVSEKFMDINSITGNAYYFASVKETVTNISCSSGDLLIAATTGVITSTDWTIIGTSQTDKQINPNGSSSLRIVIAYKYATSSNESISTKSHESVNPHLITMAFPNATGFTFNGFRYQNNADAPLKTKFTITRPTSPVVLWTLYRSYWTTTTPYTPWAVSNDSKLFQYSGSNSAPRLLCALDTSDDSSVTFTSPSGSDKDSYLGSILSIDMPLTPYFKEINYEDVPEIDTIVIEAKEKFPLSKVFISRPLTLIPENIRAGVEISGITGTCIAGGGDFDSSDPLLKYFYYRLQSAERKIILTQILYDVLYEDQGNYDITIPDTIGGFNTVIALGGVI